jgi:hypothetical protein
MEKKMAKFVAVQVSGNQEINEDSFQKFTSKELKKTFKCKKVAELKYCKKSNSKLAEFTEISEYKLNQLSRILTSTDLDDMSENRYGSDEDTKIFIVSDDALATSLAFDVLKNKCIIKFFQLDEEEVTNCIHSIETIQSADDLISSLYEAKELCESLNAIESDLGLSLVYHSAIDEIDEKIYDTESDVETSKETLEEIFEAQWN